MSLKERQRQGYAHDVSPVEILRGKRPSHASARIDMSPKDQHSDLRRGVS